MFFHCRFTAFHGIVHCRFAIFRYGDAGPKQDATVVARARENGVAVVEANVGLLMMVRRPR